MHNIFIDKVQCCRFVVEASHIEKKNVNLLKVYIKCYLVHNMK